MNSRIDTLIAEFAQNLRAAIAEEAAAAFATVAGAGTDAGNARRSKPGPKPKAVAKNGGRLRRSAEDLEAQGARILAFVKKNPGARAEQIGAGLGLATKEMARPIANLLASKQLSKKGAKRATAYSAR